MKIKKREKLQMAAILCIGAAAAISVGIWKERYSIVTSLYRNPSGSGSYTAELEAQIEGEKGKEDISIDVPEQTYAEDTIEERLKLAEDKLEALVLGHNESFDKVTSDLNLVTKIPDTGIKVSWLVSNYSLMDGNGHIVTADPGEDGSTATITAELSYGEHQRIWEKQILICRAKLSGKEQVLLELQSMLNEGVSESMEQQKVQLPDEIDGKKIVWRIRGDFTAAYILMLSVILAGLIPAKRIQNEKEAAAKRKQELEAVYPDLVRRFQLYTGAGMSVRNAFQKLSEDYEKERGENAHICRELQRLVREIGSGLSEIQCYEAFGERCGTSSYRKFAAILSQNLRKGTKGMRDILKKEADEAFEERKALARRRGEEAGTKLLGPMFLMLATVLVIIIIPAFLSIQI